MKIIKICAVIEGGKIQFTVHILESLSSISEGNLVFVRETEFRELLKHKDSLLCTFCYLSGFNHNCRDKITILSFKLEGLRTVSMASS